MTRLFFTDVANGAGRMGFGEKLRRWLKRRFYRLADHASLIGGLVDVYPHVRVKPFDELLGVVAFESMVRCVAGEESYDECAYFATSLLGPPVEFCEERALDEAGRLAVEFEAMGIRARVHPLTMAWLAPASLR